MTNEVPEPTGRIDTIGATCADAVVTVALASTAVIAAVLGRPRRAEYLADRVQNA